MERQAEPILAATGLELVPANAGWSIISSDLQHKGKELRIDLKDGKRFVEYLRSLSPDKVSDSQVAGLEKVVSALTKQFRNEYDLTSADDNRMLEFLGNLSDIIDEYKRIGGEDRKDLADSVSQFEGYLKGSRGGFLREYLSAEKLLLNKPFDDEGFVLRWHIDASPEYLQKRWNEVIDLLQVISSNDRAPELYDQAKKTATEALDSAIREITEKHENGYMNADRKKKIPLDTQFCESSDAGILAICPLSHSGSSLQPFSPKASRSSRVTFA